MKKKYSIFIASLLIAFSVQSCDFNDLESSDLIGDPFKDLDGVANSVNGAYSQVSLRETIRLADYIADDTKQGGQAGGSGSDSYAWRYSAGTGDHNEMWEKQYAQINLANRILKYAPDVAVSSDEDKTRLDNYLGDAYFLRAYAHFELLRFFSDFKKEDGLGIPYMDHVHIFEQPGRDKVSVCFDNIIADLKKAESLLNADTPSKVAFASKTAVNAMLARVSLYRGKYEDAKDYAEKVLEKVSPADASEYANVWSDKGNAGVIFKLPRYAGDARIGGVFISQDNSHVFGPSQKYMAIYSDKDLRKDLFFGKGPDREGNIVDIVKKYIGVPETIGLNDEKILRAEESKLIEIEALARLGSAAQLQKANQELNTFRSVKISDWTAKTYNQDQLLDEILLERRRELAFEAHRFFDLRRFSKDIVRDNDITILKANDYRQIMPIPQYELEANGGIPKSDQNPKY